MTDNSHLEPLRDIATVAHEDGPDLTLNAVKIPQKVLLAIQDEDAGGEMIPVGVCNLRVERETKEHPARVWGVPEFDEAVVPWHAAYGPRPKLFLGLDGGEALVDEETGGIVYHGGEVVSVAIFTEMQLAEAMGLNVIPQEEQ